MGSPLYKVKNHYKPDGNYLGIFKNFIYVGKSKYGPIWIFSVTRVETYEQINRLQTTLINRFEL